MLIRKYVIVHWHRGNTPWCSNVVVFRFLITLQLVRVKRSKPNQAQTSLYFVLTFIELEGGSWRQL